MLITETIEKNGKEFLHNYSDANKYIIKVGTTEKYAEAYDPVKYVGIRIYEETDEDIKETEDTDDIMPVDDNVLSATDAEEQV